MPCYALLCAKHYSADKGAPVLSPPNLLCHQIRAVAVHTLTVLQEAAAQDAGDSQRMEIKPLHADTALIPAQGALGMKKEGRLRPSRADGWAVAIA